MYSVITILILNKDIFCTAKFVLLQRCLEHFNFVSESVINAILEDTLPADLRNIDQTLPRIPRDTMVLSTYFFSVVNS